MSNRAMRRQMMRNQTKKSDQLLNGYSRAQRIERLMTQGISPDDLKSEHKAGFEDGYRIGRDETLRGCYASICLALKEEFGFGKSRILRALTNVDRKLIYMLDSQELLQQTLESCDIEINIDDPLERVSTIR